MAANLQSRGLASFGKRFVAQIQSPHSIAPFTLRSVHNSNYDKNTDESIHPVVIPPQTEEYWAPHPKTGVFGPGADASPCSGQDLGVHAGAESVLEEKAFFRPQEGLEKPPVQVQP